MAQSPRAKNENAFDTLSKMEIPASVRDFAEKGAVQAKDTVTKFKVVAEEASDAFEGAYTSASKGVSALGLKVIESTRTNSNAAFDHASALFGAKTVADFVELNTSFFRGQSEALSAQVKELGELSQKIAAETFAPVRSQLEKTFKNRV